MTLLCCCCCCRCRCRRCRRCSRRRWWWCWWLRVVGLFGRKKRVEKRIGGGVLAAENRRTGKECQTGAKHDAASGVCQAPELWLKIAADGLRAGGKTPGEQTHAARKGKRGWWWSACKGGGGTRGNAEQSRGGYLGHRFYCTGATCRTIAVPFGREISPGELEGRKEGRKGDQGVW